MRAGASAFLTLVSVGAIGCSSPVAGDLDQGQADRVVVALSQAGLDPEKEPDVANQGKFQVSVTRDDATRALAVLAAEGLPRPPAVSVLDAVGKDDLVPSPEAERAQLAAGLAGELETSLEAVDGVLRARVHLSMPDADPLREGPTPKATASVLLTTRPGPSPIAADAVQRLVAGAAPSLAPADVVVVIVPQAALAPSTAAELAHVGPIAVARGSSRTLVGILASLLALVIATTSAMLVFYMRSLRLRKPRRS